MRVHLVCNPASGGSTDSVDVATRLERHGARLVEAAGAARIAVSGGDGTVARGAELAVTGRPADAEDGRLELLVLPAGAASPSSGSRYGEIVVAGGPVHLEVDRSGSTR